MAVLGEGSRSIERSLAWLIMSQTRVFGIAFASTRHFMQQCAMQSVVVVIMADAIPTYLHNIQRKSATLMQLRRHAIWDARRPNVIGVLSIA